MKIMTNEELIHHFAHGISEQRWMSVVAQSEHFVIFRIKGHTDWSGVGMRDYYPSEHVLIRKGQWWLSTGVQRKDWQGRVSKKVLLAALTEAEAKGEIKA